MLFPMARYGESGLKQSIVSQADAVAERAKAVLLLEQMQKSRPLKPPGK